MKIQLRKCRVGWNHCGKSEEWEALFTRDRLVLAVGGYARKDGAKRGMIRFLESIGARTDNLEWEEA